MGIGERENGSLLVASFFRLFLEGWKTFFCFSYVEMPNHFSFFLSLFFHLCIESMTYDSSN